MKIFYNTKLVYFLIIFLFHSTLNAQLFEKLNGPYGGGGKVYEGKSGVLFQIMKYNVLYRSDNSGSTWSKMPTTPANIWSLNLNVGGDGNLFCVNGSALYRSNDNGESWIEIDFAGSWILMATSLPDGTILLTSYDQIWQSSDNGKNWLSSNIRNIQQFFYNNQKDEAYALTTDSIFVSKDKGIHWQFFYADRFGNQGNDFNIASNGTILISGEKYIWKFDATGQLIAKLDPDGSGISKVDMALTSTGRLFVSGVSESFYSDDLGQTWTEVNLHGANHYALYSFGSTSSGLLFGVKTGGGGLYRSSDNGKNWIFSAYGLNYAAISELDFISDLKLLALTSDGLFYSEDGGQNWTFLLESEEQTSYGSELNHIVTYGEEFYFFDYRSIYYFKNVNSPPIVVKSISDPFFRGMQLFVNPLTGSLFYSDYLNFLTGGLYKSIDKGNNWHYIPLVGAQSFHTFKDSSIITAGTDGIYRSIDDGEKWDLVFSNGALGIGYDHKILSNSASGAYLFCENSPTLQIASTIDFGVTWNSQVLDRTNSNNLHLYYGQALNNLDYFYVSGFSDQVFRSVDQGRTFNLFSDIEAVSGLSISDDQKLYALTWLNGLHRTKVSTSSTNVLRGIVFKDSNSNCDKNSMETAISNRLIIADNGTDKEYGYSRKNGSFVIPLKTGNYNLSIETENIYWSSCTKAISVSTYNLNDTLQLGLQVKSLCPFMKVDIQSSLLRRCVETIIYIDYANTGTLKAENAYIDVSLDPFFEYISSSIPFVSQNGNVYRFLLGDVEENTSGTFTIKIKVSCNSKLGQIHCAEAHIYPDSSCILTSQAIVKTNANCLGDSIDFIIRNAGNKNMTTVKKWTAIDESKSGRNIQSIDAGSFYLNAGQVITKRIASVDKVLFIAEQDDSYPYNKSSQTEIISCAQNPQPGSVPLNINNQDEEEPYLSKFCKPNRGSFDPNDITGYPVGITDKKYIDKEQQLEYIIRFQNTGTDTAFNIRIENKIPAKELDLLTLTLGASSHPYQFILSPEGKLIFSFSNILLPDSNINEKTSHGFIQYSIKPIDKLSNGTRILNDAQIYFDFNDGVNTNVDLHTIGSPIPVKVNNSGQSDEINFQIEPNPMTTFCTIIISAKAKNEHYRLSCLDVNSKQMWEMDVKGNRANISKGELKPGVYLLVLKTANGLPIKSQKFIVE